MNKVVYLLVVMSLSLASGCAQVALRDLVHDPQLRAGAALPPVSPDSLHSEWALNGSTYVVAYRNADNTDSFDTVADIYYKNPGKDRLRKLLSIVVSMRVDDVKVVSITNDSESQLAFFCSSGQQEWLVVLALHGPTARKLFDYGTTSIKVAPDQPHRILAYSHSTGRTETFEWCRAKQKIVLESACRSN